MDFEWGGQPMDGSLKAQEVEESFEDPFAVRLLPDSPRFAAQARYFNLGKTAQGAGVFSVYRTNGRLARVVFARIFTAEEAFFYDRQQARTLTQKEL
jgi:hypothetical protein